MNALYSHWNTKYGGNGYNNFSEFVMTMALSVLVTKKHYNKVKLVTNSMYKKILIDELEMPFDEVSTSHDRFSELPGWLWGYTKIASLQEQSEEFVHIDNDVFLWSGIDTSVSSNPVYFQSLETPFKDFYRYYAPLLEFSKSLPNFPDIIKSNPVDYAFNCGVIGINDLDIIKEWFKIVTDTVTDASNLAVYNNDRELIIHQNLLHEQYFIASLCKHRGLSPGNGVGFIIDYKNIDKDCYNKNYTHLWGNSKKSEYIMKKVKNRLLKDHPKYGSFLLEKVNQLF